MCVLQSSSTSNDSPKFYTNDIISILKERNELKERVIDLEEEVATLKQYVCVNLGDCYFCLKQMVSYLHV